MMDKYGVDVFRFFLLKEGSVDQDNNFSEKLLLDTTNNLADQLGNMLSRCIAKSMLSFETLPPIGDGEGNLTTEVSGVLMTKAERLCCQNCRLMCMFVCFSPLSCRCFLCRTAR